MAPLGLLERLRLRLASKAWAVFCWANRLDPSGFYASNRLHPPVVQQIDDWFAEYDDGRSEWYTTLRSHVMALARENQS